jgi:hypothetical protein
MNDIDDAFAHSFPHEAVGEVLKILPQFTGSA